MCSIEEGSQAQEPAGQPEPRAPEVPASPAADGVRGVRFEVPAVAAALVAAARSVVDMDADAIDEDTRFGLLDALEQVERLTTAASMQVLGALDDDAAPDSRFGMTVPVFCENRHGRNRDVVRSRMIVGRRLSKRMPAVFEAVRAGTLATDRAEVIARAVNARNEDALFAAQKSLLDLAVAEPSFKLFKALVMDLARYADADGGHDPEPPRSRARCKRSGDEVSLEATFVGADGASFEQLVEAETDRLWRAWQRDREQCPELEVPTRTELRAKATLELVRRGAAADPSNTKGTVVELSLVVDADRVAELDPILAGVLDPTARAWSSGPPAPSNGSPLRFPPFPISTPSGEQLWFVPEEWEMVCCDPHISEVILDAMGVPVAVRDRDRHPNRATRRALVVRDGGCAFPGCDCPPAWCDAHHVVRWKDKGKTEIRNLVLLCRRHHGIVHRSGWSILVNDRPGPGQGFFTIVTAGGARLQTQHRRRPGGPPSGRPVDAGSPPGRPAVPA
jgi:hypothetical protein